MPRQKTLLTPGRQWELTADYCMHAYRKYDVWQRVDDMDNCICLFHGTHPLVQDGDAFIATSRNGMVQRFGMTGISSKGARLFNYHLPLRHGFEEAELPDDFIGMQWNDPAIRRFVADLRASCRGRVSANSPAYSHCKVSPSIDTNGITFSGLYKSARVPDAGALNIYRHFLRFYPDGSVVSTRDLSSQGWRISFHPDATSPIADHYTPRGTVQMMDQGRVAFLLFDAAGALVEQYEGQFLHGRLWLRCLDHKGKLVHDELPYRFHPFDPAAY